MKKTGESPVVLFLQNKWADAVLLHVEGNSLRLLVQEEFDEAEYGIRTYCTLYGQFVSVKTSSDTVPFFMDYGMALSEELKSHFGGGDRTPQDELGVGCRV